MKDRKILVVGANGFLGRPLCKYLIELGCNEVFCADLINPHIDGATFLELNLLKDDLLKRLFGFKDSIIINLTGQVTRPSNLCLSLNTIGLDKLIHFASVTESFLLQISTVGVFGTVKEAHEYSPRNPETVYSTCKAFGEFAIEKGCDPKRFAIIRLSNLYGYNQEKGIMAYLKRSYESDRQLYFNNNGSLKRAYLNVDDCAKMLADVVVNKTCALHGNYNFLGRDIFTIHELIKMFEEMSGISFECVFEKLNPYDNTEHIESKLWDSLVGDQYKHSVKEYFQSFIHGS